MTAFLESFSKNIRSIIAFIIAVGGITWIFVYPHENKEAIIGMIAVITGYYFVQSKDSSDRLKADISQKNASEVVETTKKDANEPE